MEHYEQDAECNCKIEDTLWKSFYIKHLRDRSKERAYQIRNIYSSTAELSHTNCNGINKRRFNRWKAFVMKSGNTNMLDVMLVNFNEVY